jgi:toxin ParE1/3/4
VTRVLELSPRAEASLDEIGAYSAREFGTARGRRYVLELLAGCRGILKGTVRHWACRGRFAVDMREDLRFARCGRHYIIFILTPQAVLVADFLHQSSDIAARLEKLP